jgi:hypothetical protein
VIGLPICNKSVICVEISVFNSSASLCHVVHLLNKVLDLNIILKKTNRDMLIKVTNLRLCSNLGTAFLENTGSIINLKRGRNVFNVRYKFSL